MRQCISVWLTKLYVHYCVRVDPRAKCPACGHRIKHKVVFSAAYGSLIHQCGFCNAAWPEPPLVAVPQWAIEQPAEPAAEEKAPAAPFGAGREPLRAKAL